MGTATGKQQVQFEAMARHADRIALRYAAPTGVVAFVLAWGLNFGRNPVPLGDDIPSFGPLTLLFGIIVALVYGAFAYAHGARRAKLLSPPRYHKQWYWSLAPLVIANAIMIGVLLGVAMQLIGMAFRDLALPREFAASFVGLVTAAVAYFIINELMQVGVNDVLRVFLVILVGGLFFSAVKVQNPLWWEKSFSYLGTHFSDERTVFNATIITSGILLIILQQYFMEDFFILRDHGKLSSRKTNIVRGSLIALGVLMLMVGVFPFDVNAKLNIVHDFSAYGMAAILLAFMAFGKWIVPGLPHEFYVTSWILLGFTLTAMLLMVAQLINTVGIELIAFTLGGTWLLMFIKSVHLHAEHVEEHLTRPT